MDPLIIILVVFDEFIFLGCEIAGDGHCDDAANEPQCDFDGGDCCLANKTTEYCQICLCYADNPKGAWSESPESLSDKAN